MDDTLVRQRYDTYRFCLNLLQLTPANVILLYRNFRLSLKAQIPLKEAHVAQVLDLLAEKRLTCTR